jgi:hypothetical protein
VASASSLQLATNGTTTAVTIDTSQNVGLGVTPSAWYSGSSTKAIQQAGGGSFWSFLNGGTSPRVYLSSNSYFNSGAGYTYINTDYATQYLQGAGQHAWYTAPSGTAGNAITFTQAMTLDVSGNFSITQTPGKYTVDTTGGATAVANGGTVDFANASGMLIVNNWTSGAVAIWLCGAGSVTLVSNISTAYGGFAYNAGINGYRWTNNTGSTANFGFFFIRTRTSA